MPKVSVAFSAYNSEETIDRAIASVLKQTMDDWEMIAVDDCSTDGTYEKMLEWGRRDPRIKVFRNETNHGIVVAKNDCFMKADPSAQYIATFDSDDICHPDRLKIQSEFLDAHPEYALVGSVVRLFDDNGYWGERRRSAERPMPKDFLRGSQHAHPTVMYRAKVLREMGYYDPKTYRCEDYEFFMKLYAASYRGYNIQTPLLDYYESNSSLKRRKFRYRLTECRVRYQGFKALGLMPLGALYTLWPIAVGMIPKPILMRIRKKRARRIEENVAT